MPPSNEATNRRETLQLSRLRTLTDVIFAIVLWRCFFLLPHPDAAILSLEAFRSYLLENWMALVSIVVGVLLTIIYWVQNNKLSADLEKTDFRHTALSIFQIFFLLLFLQSLRLGVDVGASPGTRMYESITAALVGICGGWGWSYAIKGRRLLLPDVTDDEARETSYVIVAEPLTALFTIPFAFIGPGLWELAWLAYPLFTRLLRRGHAKRTSD